MLFDEIKNPPFRRVFENRERRLKRGVEVIAEKNSCFIFFNW